MNRFRSVKFETVCSHSAFGPCFSSDEYDLNGNVACLRTTDINSHGKIDYDPTDDSSQTFFKTVQNKMHWAAHGHTADEIVYGRADANQPHMGLTSQKGKRPLKSEVSIAKNYLGKDEIEALNRIVTAYLEFAELQALQRKPMAMTDWISKLDDFLKLSDRDVLNHAGKISHQDAKEKAEMELEAYRQRLAALPQPVDEDFLQSLDELKRIENEKKKDSNNE